MGKTSKANRTKGNTRPSSSGHSAQLLGFTSRALTGFIGFDALEKETPSYVPVTGQHVADTADNSVDADFRMVMRKMLKRDGITRLKAMQEFGEHCGEKEKDAVKNVLPFWPRLFNRLALDHDRRIREATHHANGKLLSKVKREMAPYLKNIMGVWLLGQCDLYAPASSAAQAIFASTFPSAKQSEAIMFCKAEIFSYFRDNLFEQTAKSMSDPNSTTPEDMENKFNLVISATLQALKLSISTVKTDELESLHEELLSIVVEAKFWKYAKNKEAQIRGAWYALISSICQLKPDVFKGMEKKLATTVFGCLSESDPVVAPAVWESALSIVMNYENCWQGFDIHKVALPQLWSLLKEGGKGNAHMLFPCLLPFLSKLPKDIVESETFLSQFFSCFKPSLMLESVKVSMSECDAILNAFFECLQFICCTRLGDVDAGPLLLGKILTTEVVPILESSLYEKQSSHLAVSNLFQLVGCLLSKVERHCVGKSTESFSRVLATFWHLVLPITCRAFSIPQKQETSLMFLAYFYNSLFHSSDYTIIKKKRTVRFQEEADELVSLEDFSPSHKSSTPNLLASKKAQSFPHIVGFCVNLCNKIDEDCQLGYLMLLEEIMTSASSQEFIVELVRVLTKDQRYDSGSTPGFLKKVVLSWVVRVKSDDECLSCLFNIIFLICSFVTVEEAKGVLDVCCKMHMNILEHLLRKGLSTYRSLPFFQNWLQSLCWSSEVIHRLNELVTGKKFFSDAVSESEIEGCQRILSTCLFESNTELLVEDASFETVLLLLGDLAGQLFAGKMKERNSELALHFIHNVITSILKNPKICWKFDATEKLVCLLFHTSVKDVLLFENSGEVLKILFQMLETFVDSYIEVKEEIMSETSLIRRIAKEFNFSLQTLKTHKEASHLQERCLFLISSVQKSLSKHKPDSLTFVCCQLMDSILPSLQAWDSLTNGLTINILPSFLKGKIYYPLPLDEKFSYPKQCVLRLTLASKVISGILCSELVHFEITKETTKFCMNYISEQMPHLLWCLTFCRGTRSKLEIPEKSFENQLEQSCLQMLLLLQPCEIIALKQKIFDLSLLDRCWALCLQTLGEIFPRSNLNIFGDTELETFSVLSMSESMEKYVLRQVLIPFLSCEKKELYFQELLIDLLNMQDLENEDFAGKMGEACCYFQDNQLEVSLELQHMLMTIFRTIVMFNFHNKSEDLKTTYYLQLGSIMSSAIKNNLCLLNSEVWDFFVEQLLDLLKESRSEMFDTPRSVVALHHMLTVFSSLSQLLCVSQEENPETLLDWKPPPMADEIYEQMIHLFILISKKDKNTFSPEMCDLVLSQLLQAVKFVPAKQLLDIVMLPEPTFLLALVASLMSSVQQLQFASHVILLKMMPLLPAYLSDVLQNESEDDVEEDMKRKEDIEKKEEFERIPTKLTPLLQMLKFLNEVVESMLLDIKIGDLCTVVPHTDSYGISMGYLLAWINILEFISSSPSQIRLGYATDLEEKKLLPSLFANVFRLMPENPFLCLKKGLKVETPKKEDLKLLFIHPPALQSGLPSSEEIQSIACYVFSTALRKVPASIRTWWNNLDRKSADIVNNFTSKYVSGHLCVAEIQAVHENEKQFENLMVQARPGSREVIATYTIDDCAIELCVQLPINYPLGPISAERRGKVVIGQLEWRHWLMQLTTVLTYQNGSILDGLSIWKRNLDKKFEGVEECMICYYVLHSTTLKLPRLSCHVCRKKYHSACLYKWFRTSNNFTCPLCRNEFAM